MKLKTILVLFIILLLIVFFKFSIKKWKKYNVLSKYYKINDLIFFDKNEGILSGSFRSENLLFNSGFRETMVKQKAIILKTNDGGLHWTKVYEDIGEVTKLSGGKDIIYALKKTYHSINNNMKLQKKSHLLKSFDGGRTWIQIKTFEQLIYKVFFYNSLNGIAWGVHQNGVTCFVITSSDGGRSWRPVYFSATPEISSFSPILYHPGIIIYCSSNKIIKKNLDNGVEISEKLPPNFEPELLTLDQDSNVWIIGVSENNIKLFRKPMKGGFEIIPIPFEKKMFSIEELFVFKDTINIF